MKPKEREALANRLASMEMNERNRIYKRAAKLRKAAQRTTAKSKRGRRMRGYEIDDSRDERPTKQRKSPSLHEYALQVLAQDEAIASPQPLAPDTRSDTARAALVVGLTSGRCDVRLDGAVKSASLHGAQNAHDGGIAVGDRVLVRDAPDACVVLRVLPRSSALERRDPHNPHRTRVVVANVDVVVIVVACKQPPIRTGLIDRFLIATTRGGASAVVCANKTDLCCNDAERDAELAKLAPFRERGIPVVACSAQDADGVAELRAELTGKLCAFVGKSGVGKSSLVNALAPDLALATGAVREGDGKGRHTTTAASLRELPGDVRIIDTPGIRAFGLDDLDAGSLLPHFPEFAEFATSCRFGDCTHAHEPDCGVRQALETGAIARERWAAYLRLLGVADDS